MRYRWIIPIIFSALILAVPASALQIITDGTTIIIDNETLKEKGFYTIGYLSVKGVLAPDGVLDFTGDVNIQGEDVSVSLFFNVEDIGVESLSIDGKSSQIFFTPDRGYFFIADEGRHSIKGTAKIREKAIQDGKVPFGVMGPVTLLDLDLEIKGSTDKYLHIISPLEGTKTSLLGGTQYKGEFYGVFNKTIVFEWQERGYKPEEAPTIPKIFTQAVSWLHFSETEVISENRIVYTSHNQEMTVLRIRTSGDILSVSSNTAIQWESVVEDGKTVLVVTPAQPVTQIEIAVITQLTPEEYPTSFRVIYPVVAEDVDSQKSYLVVSSDPEISVKTTPNDFRETSLDEVPNGFEKGLKTIAFIGEPTGFFDFEVEKLEIVPVITASADSGSYTHVVLEDGGILSDVTWRVRNTAEEYMFVKLPEDSTLFYVGIDGESVKPTMSDEELAIPLKRSEYAYPIEVIYYNPNQYRFAGRADLPLPTTGIPISNLDVVGYIPLDAYFLGASTNLRKNTSTDLPSWRGLVMFLIFLLIVAYAFAYVAIEEVYRKRFSIFGAVFLYFLNVFHQGLFALFVVFALGYFLKQYIQIERGKLKWILAVAAVVVIFFTILYGLQSSMTRSAGERLERSIDTPSMAMEQEIAPLAGMAEKLAAPPATMAPSVPTKKGVKGVKLLVPRSGRYLSFSTHFKTVDKTPILRIYHMSRDIIYIHYILAIILGYMVYIRFLSWRQIFE